MPQTFREYWFVMSLVASFEMCVLRDPEHGASL